MSEPMTPEMLQEIQEFPDSMGMGHLVREVERCWAALNRYKKRDELWPKIVEELEFPERNSQSDVDKLVAWCKEVTDD